MNSFNVFIYSSSKFLFQHENSFWGGVLLYDAGETITIVGDHDPALLKYFDCTRSGPRSAFDSNVVYQFEIMEYVSWLFFLFSVFECNISSFMKMEHNMPVIFYVPQCPLLYF